MIARRPDVSDPIATREMILVAPDGSETTLLVILGRPYVVDDGEARCPVQVKGLDPRYPDISGSDAFHAMRLALSLVASRLIHQLEKGLTLRDVGFVEPYDAQAIAELFCPDLRRAAPPFRSRFQVRARTPPSMTRQAIPRRSGRGVG